MSARKSRRWVASASTSSARRARSAVFISAPTAASALTDVIPMIASAATASKSVIPRLARIGPRDAAPCVERYEHGGTLSAHEHRVGENRTGRTEDVLEPRLVGHHGFGDVERNRPDGILAHADHAAR